MGQFLDNLAAARLIYVLVQPFKKSPAFKLGIIDKDGNQLKKMSELKTSDEKDAYDYLHRIVFKLKRLLMKLPGGDSQLKSLGAAYLMVREISNYADMSDKEILERTGHLMEYYTEEDEVLAEEVMAMSTTCGNVAGKSGPNLVPLLRRKQEKMQTLSGLPTKPLSFKEFVKSKNK